MNNKSELEARVKWSLALITELVQSGRAAGWLDGEPLAVSTDCDALLNETAGISGSPMRVLASRFELSNVEHDLLWLLACIELDPHVSTAAQLLMPPGTAELSAQVVERLVGHGQALDADVFDRLEGFALIQCDSRLPLNRRPVRVHERVVDLARGQMQLDRRMKSYAVIEDALQVRRRCDGIETEIPAEVHRGLARRALVVAVGSEGVGRSTLLRRAVSTTGRSVLTVRAASLSTAEIEFAHQLRCIQRECRLLDAVPLIINIDTLTDRAALLDAAFLAESSTSVLATSRESQCWQASRPTVTVNVSLPAATARAQLWQRVLPTASRDVVSACADRYTITPSAIEAGAAAARSLACDGPIDVSHVHRGLRAHLERGLGGLARRIETRQTWNDLVLPVDQFDMLIEMAARVRHKQRVLGQWGFAAKVGRGLGLSALFSGPPGTGKTMIAGLLANELGLDLYQVDLSKVVSKYIGETEKQLASLFEAAESGHAILLFDEADSLFAKRTEVKSSNDRYANLEVNYLLQRIEAFSGITIMTTNHETAIDQAFLRRLAFHVRVPMPDEEQRELIWRSMLPDQADRAADLEFRPLAEEFEMSGGYIKNAMLRAAFLSAEDGTSISNEHLWRAARSEYEAMGKLSFSRES